MKIMELDGKIKDYRVLFNNERIPCLSIDTTKKRFIFSRKIKGKNLKVRFSFSKILTYRNYANMIAECKIQNDEFEKYIEDSQLKIKPYKPYIKNFSVNTISNSFREKFESIEKKSEKKKKNNERRRNINQQRKRIRFVNSIPKPLKMKLVDDIKTSHLKGEDFEKIRKMKIDYKRMTPEVYHSIKETAKKWGVEVDNSKEIGTKSIRNYIK